jgi:predicted nucleic acid-binding Zn ribbon protein
VDMLRNEKPIFWNPAKQELRTGLEPIGTEETDIVSTQINNFVVVDKYSLLFYNQTQKQKIILYWKDPQNPAIERSRDLYIPEELNPYIVNMLRYEKPVFWNDETGEMSTGMEPAGTGEIDNQAMSIDDDNRSMLIDNYMLMFNLDLKETKIRLNWKDYKNPMVNFSHDISIFNQNIMFVIDMLRNEKPVFWNIKKETLFTLQEPASIGDSTPQTMLSSTSKIIGIPESKFDSSVEPIVDSDDEVFQIIKYKPLSECPQCKGEVRRLIGGGMGIIFKGNGFYTTDYKKSSVASSSNPTKDKSPKNTAAKENSSSQEGTNKETGISSNKTEALAS